MNEILDGIKQAFWNPDEMRLRALFRVPATFGLLLLVVSIIVGIVGWVDGLLGLPAIYPQVVTFGLITVAFVALAWFIDRRHMRDMGLGLDRQWGRDLCAGFAVGGVMVLVTVGTLLAAGLATVGSTYAVEDPQFSFNAGSAAVGVLYGFLFFAVFATLEEVLVRGYLLVNVAEGVRRLTDTDRGAVLVAVTGTACLFGLLHAANPGGTALSLLNITVAGLFFGLAFVVTDRLAIPIGAHIAWNFGLGSVFGLPVSGLRTDAALFGVEPNGATLLTGGSFGPEGGVVMLVGLAAGVGVFLVWTRQQYGTIAVNERIAIPDLWVTDDTES